jgi:CDP-diacylglycerol---serine O-phosphatidyltransferase
MRRIGLVRDPSRRRRRIPELRKGVYILPNLFTTAGLFAGFYSIIATLNHDYRLAAIMILASMLCDTLDGRIARLTRSSSSFGVQYDSLADLIAFGVAPGILVYTWALRPWGRWGWLAATLYVTCGALRLARFNVQIASVERRHFVGLPIPSGAAVIASTVLLYYYLSGQGDPNKHILMLLVIYAVAGLMVSEFRYFSFKEVKLHRRHPFPVLLALIVLIMLTIGAPEVTLFLGITGYALSAPVAALWRLVRGRRRATTSPAATGDAALRPAVRPAAGYDARRGTTTE